MESSFGIKGEMQKKINEYWKAPPLRTEKWSDPSTGATGWLVISNKANGVCGGGIRMASGCTAEEVAILAKTMGLKFTLLEPRVGGAKSGIRFDPKSGKKQEVLDRFVKFLEPHFKAGYGTGGDMNVSEAELLNSLDRIGIKNPQEGIIEGLRRTDTPELRNIGTLGADEGLMQPYESGHLWDYAAGRGVASAIECFYELTGKQLHDARISIQGFGAVGGSAAKFLHGMGTRIVAISDEFCAVTNENGLNIPELLDERIDGKWINKKTECDVNFSEREKLLLVDADILVPAAGSQLINADNCIGIGPGLVVEGANAPLTREAEDALLRKGVLIIPDFIANCGAAALAHYCMLSKSKISPEGAFRYIDDVIRRSLTETFAKAEKTRIRDYRLVAQSLAIDKMGGA